MQFFLVFAAVVGCATSSGTDAETPDAAPDTSISDSGPAVDSGPTCTDSFVNGDETDVDCGGSCDPCNAGRSCGGPTDCISGDCTMGICVDPACDDGVQNGMESDVDCGGACEPCMMGQPCNGGGDCVSRVCGADMLCAAPACDDRIRNGDESDVDCGGSCAACGDCRGCTSDDHCARGRCVMGRCALETELYVDWRTHCSTDGSLRVTADLPAGMYRVTAVNSGGTVWGSAAPPTRGWYYRIECENLVAPTVATPSGIYYANAATAYASLMSTTEDVDFAGGTLVCRKIDSACTDNSGGVRFRLERLCM